MVKHCASLIVLLSLLCACSSVPETNTGDPVPTLPVNNVSQEAPEPNSTSPDIEQTEGPAALLYMGQASIRIVTSEGKVIYIDPYAGNDYDLPADLILVTHDHYDHSDTEKVANRNDGCVTITHKEAVINGEHQIFELGYVTVEAVEAGYNNWHDVNECVGYVLTFSGGRSVYVSGDTSTTEQMPTLAEKEIDYAFFCCDGVFNMGLEEAARCAEMVGAKHNIPYHNSTSNIGEMFDRELAGQFEAENRLIVVPGAELLIE